jgi:hypothetical protein
LGEFSPIGDCSPWVVFVRITEVAQIIGLLFSTVTDMYVVIFTKMDLATFWATFSKTHLVILPTANPTIVSCNSSVPKNYSATKSTVCFSKK